MVGLLALGVCSLQAVNQKVTHVFSTILAGYQGDASLGDSSDQPMTPADKAGNGVMQKKPTQPQHPEDKDPNAAPAEEGEGSGDEDSDNEED